MGGVGAYLQLVSCGSGTLVCLYLVGREGGLLCSWTGVWVFWEVLRVGVVYRQRILFPFGKERSAINGRNLNTGVFSTPIPVLRPCLRM
jgi:hypothetical protein